MELNFTTLFMKIRVCTVHFADKITTISLFNEKNATDAVVMSEGNDALFMTSLTCYYPAFDLQQSVLELYQTSKYKHSLRP